ncbi:formylglycine-generating enzyme family protein [Rhodoferax sp.]|jgi:formylglycine-generating enzyme required for sulfatase activity|uniref:formylglycine-generating enzyme family protein n=1 Tax=Rhodoferax sp. TaxID=50421 RepID=UPI0037834491
MDERVVYPGQADRESAQTAGLARYWETDAKGLEQQVRQDEKAAIEVSTATPPFQPPTSVPPAVPPQAPSPQPANSGGFNWAWVPMVVALLGVSVYFKFQREQDQRRIEEFGRMVAKTDTPSTAERILGGASQDAAQAAQQPFEPEMVLIPAGTFIMGSPASEPERVIDEGPQHTVQVAAFELGKTEVTFAQWDACVADGGCSHRPGDEGWGRGDRPVINVSWNDITEQYIPWLNRKTGMSYRLPSEAEWEYAARSGCTTAFNVGGACSDKIELSQANFDGNYTYNGSRKGNSLEKTVAVGSYEANSWDVHDMHGNVWEWVQDCRNSGYNGAPGSGTAWVSGDCGSRMLRGGGWYYQPEYLRAAVRGWLSPDDRINFSGFRLARSVS